MRKAPFYPLVKLLSFQVLLLSFVYTGFTQESFPSDCGVETIQTSPEYEQQYREAMLRSRKRTPGQKNNVVYTVPVVIHVVHDGDPIGSQNNPTDATLIAILEEASQRFRHSHPGADTYPNNPYYGVDTEIEFCLATTDPNGNYTTGIVRHYDPENAIGTYNELCGGLAPMAWNTDQYCNLYLVDDMTNASGVACGNVTIYDGGNAFWSGLIAHEVGHFFSLIHTFGPNSGCPANTDCLTSEDRVCDTPPKGFAGTQGGTCETPNNTCTTDEADTTLNNPYRSLALGGLGDQPDMLANYLDYTGSCWDAFTQGQKDRMRFNIENSRVGLMTSAATACAPQPPPVNDVALLEVISNHSSCSSTFTPSVTMKNQGTIGLSSLVLKAYIDEVLQVTESWSGSLAPGVETTVAFTNSLSLVSGLRELKIVAEQPNGATDGHFNDNEIFTQLYYSETGNALPFSEDFTGCQTPIGLMYNGWTFIDYPASSTCQSCLASAVSFQNNVVSFTLTLPLLDFSGISNPSLSFSMGHIPRYDYIPDDELRVEISTNCGAPNVVFQQSGLDKATNDPPAYSGGVYTLPSCDEFRTETVDLSAFSGQNQVQITFVAYGEWWSPLLLDDISITDTDNCNVPPPATGSISSGTYRGTDLVSGGTIEVPASVTFSATNSIRLTSNFRVYPGASFHGLIEACLPAARENIAVSPPRVKKKEVSAPSFPIMTVAPNPFSGTTQIYYELEEDAPISMQVFDINGQRVAPLLRQQMAEGGKHQITFDGSQQAAGTYFVVLQTSQGVVTKRLVLIKF